MSKAVDYVNSLEPFYQDCGCTLFGKGQMIKCYLQAEKDNALTWEDMMLIHKCIKDAMNYHLYKMIEGMEGQKIVYQEVLRRFLEQKGGKV